MLKGVERNDVDSKQQLVYHWSPGPLSSVMTNRFGFQLVVMIGGLLISTGTITTSFTSSINQMYITYGLVAGITYITKTLFLKVTYWFYSLN